MMNKNELILKNLKSGDSINVLINDSVRSCIVTHNIPSINKIELRYKIVDVWTKVFNYKEISKGIYDLNINERDLKIDEILND